MVVNPPLLGGQLGGDGGSINARQRLEDETGDGHQGTGIAGTDAGIGLTGLDLFDGDAHGGVPPVAQGPAPGCRPCE